jgi:flagellar biosynthesis protein FliP
MPHKKIRFAAYAAILIGLTLITGMAEGAIPGIDITLADKTASRQEVSTAIQVLIGLTLLSMAPALLFSVTSFVRIIIVLSMLRHAIGMQETPPNTVLVSLALFLTLFTMQPVLNQVNVTAVQPYLNNTIGAEEAYKKAAKPIRDFMVRQTREQDMALMLDISHSEPLKSVDDISLVQLIPAFMLNELRAAFQIGFIIFLPFLLVDLIISTVLMSLGMMMVPPVMISLPIKILLFVLIDGWNLVVRSLVGSFH